MKNIILLLILFCTLSMARLYAQDLFSTAPAKSTEIGLVYGIPMGDFGSTEGENAGFASPGLGININSRVKYNSGVLFTSYSSFQWNNIDTDAMNEQLNTSNLVNTKVAGGSYKPFISMIGLGYSLDIGNSIEIDFRPGIGVLYNSFDELDVSISDNNGNIISDGFLTFDSDFAFVYGGGVHISLEVVKDLVSFGIYAHYAQGDLKTILRGDFSGNQTIEPMRVHENIQLLNTGFNIIIKRS